MENQAVWNAILALVAVVQNFPRNFHANIFAEIMPRLTANLPAIVDAPNINTDDKNNMNNLSSLLKDSEIFTGKK
jgi:hypothetical protein